MPQVLLLQGPRGRLEVYTRPSGRTPFEEFRKPVESHIWERFVRIFGRFQQEGMGIAGNSVFKPLTGRGKGIWEWKQFDHRLYAFRGPDYGTAARVVLLNGWVKDKDNSIGGGVEDNRQIEKAIALRDECLTDAVWAEAPPALEVPAPVEPETEVDEGEDEPETAAEPEPGWLDLVAVADRLGVRRKRLRRWIDHKALVPDRKIDRAVWWREESMPALTVAVAKLKAAQAAKKGKAEMETQAARQGPMPPPAPLPTPTSMPPLAQAEPPGLGWLGSRELAERLGVHKSRVISLVRNGTLKPQATRPGKGGNQAFYWREETMPALAATVASYVDGRKRVPAAPPAPPAFPASGALVTRASLLALAGEVIDGKLKLREFGEKLSEYRQRIAWLEGELKRARG